MGKTRTQKILKQRTIDHVSPRRGVVGAQQWPQHPVHEDLAAHAAQRVRDHLLRGQGLRVQPVPLLPHVHVHDVLVRVGVRRTRAAGAGVGAGPQAEVHRAGARLGVGDARANRARVGDTRQGAVGGARGAAARALEVALVHGLHGEDGGDLLEEQLLGDALGPRAHAPVVGQHAQVTVGKNQRGEEARGLGDVHGTTAGQASTLSGDTRKVPSASHHKTQ